MIDDSKITVENVNHPGKINKVDRAKYLAMKAAVLPVLPIQSPGLNQTELREAVIPHLPKDLFPGGKTAGCWVKTVQLDLEAKGIQVREKSKPLR